MPCADTADRAQITLSTGLQGRLGVSCLWLGASGVRELALAATNQCGPNMAAGRIHNLVGLDKIRWMRCVFLAFFLR